MINALYHLIDCLFYTNLKLNFYLKYKFLYCITFLLFYYIIILYSLPITVIGLILTKLE